MLNFLGPLQRFLIKPGDVFRVVIIKRDVCVG
jgi:hypothetical protein